MSFLPLAERWTVAKFEHKFEELSLTRAPILHACMKSGLVVDMGYVDDGFWSFVCHSSQLAMSKAQEAPSMPARPLT